MAGLEKPTVEFHNGLLRQHKTLNDVGYTTLAETSCATMT